MSKFLFVYSTKKRTILQKLHYPSAAYYGTTVLVKVAPRQFLLSTDEGIFFFDVDM